MNDKFPYRNHHELDLDNRELETLGCHDEREGKLRIQEVGYQRQGDQSG